ncbi:hypothetical protein DU508_12745 [Pedobacter chinensis]|uniref:Uncharacterized protein n=1 Tax=Pedobacter chinensis TaxID=2282421 RepID=A0A369PVB4_9SPHI|nr:hypothetical protein [Pedobacter chinensis]RDC56454.1 hypothetical protein DU508_12745 [Pedobacter chinensis]
MFASLNPKWQSTHQTEINGTVVLEVEVDKPNSIINQLNSVQTTFDSEEEKTYIKLLLFKGKDGMAYGCYVTEQQINL